MSKYIIIDSEAIQKRIEELEKELQYHEDWYKKARENYDRDRKFWGQADDGEMRVASDAVSENQNEIKILNQILSQSTPLIPEIEKAFDTGHCLSGRSNFRKETKEYKSYINKQDYISNLKLDI